jgi:hypothetical protein
MNKMEAKMKRGSFLVLPVIVLIFCFVSLSFAQNGTIANRETADPGGTGYTKWIKITIKGGPGGNDNLDDNFQGMKFMVDLNLDFDDNEATGNPLWVYSVRGSDGDIKSSPSGTKDYDKYLYLPIRGDSTLLWDGSGYPTNILPRVKLENAGSLRVGTAPFIFPIGIDSGFERCIDGIPPIIRYAFFYDDGRGNTNPVAGVHPGNKTAFDGYIDRVDLIWSEPMRTTNLAVLGSMFTGLGSTIYGIEPIGVWTNSTIPSVNAMRSRFSFYVVSQQPNTGLSAPMTYNPPPSDNDKFREANMAAYPSKPLNFALQQTRALTDKAGPVIVRSNTKRAMRRQPLANALISKRIQVVFSEPVLLANVVGADFSISTSATAPSANPISAIISPSVPTTSSDTYEFQLTTNFATGNETGSIQFANYMVVSDVLGNWNGLSLAEEPPTRPESSKGAVVNITDGILPIITEIVTVDANPTTELVSGGNWGWGYLDYVDVIYDHQMNTTRVSTAGFSITATGVYSIAGTGFWIGADTLRIPLVATAPKVANTGTTPSLVFTNPGDPFGQEASNSGNAENLLATDIYYNSQTNGLALTRTDGAGPAIIYSITAGYKRIRLSFSEKVNTNGWPSSLSGAQPPSRFKWYVGTIISDPTSLLAYFTGLSSVRHDSVVYINHTGSAWARTDSGGINFFTPGVVLDLHSQSNRQWDNDNTLMGRSLTGSDVRIHSDNIPPELIALETRDFNVDGKLDHYRFVFTDLSPVFPRKSFVASLWQIKGYDGDKRNLQVDLNVYNSLHSYYRSGAINAFGDTVEVYVKFDETIGTGPAETPFGGDTGDLPDVIVAPGHGFADWANNFMSEVPPGLTIEKDKVGPAIMSARTISTTEVEALLSEKAKSSTLDVYDFYLNLGTNYNAGWPISQVEQPSAGRVRITAVPFLSWLPTQTAMLNMTAPGVVTDDIAGEDNGNQQVVPIYVIDNAASHFEISLAIPGDDVGDIIADVPFQIKVRALDSHGNVDTNFPELIQISSNLTQEEIDLPDGAQKLNNGWRYITAICHVITDSLQFTISVENDRYSRFHSSSAYFRVVQGQIDGPDHCVVKDIAGDQGGWVMLVWDYSENHPGHCQNLCINYYQIFREVNGDSMLWGFVPAAPLDNTDPDSMHYAVMTNDNLASTFWVRAVYDPDFRPTDALNGNEIANSTSAVSMKEHQLIPYLSAAGKTTQTAQVEGASVKLVSSAATASGRAIDNIAPQAPANLTALREGASVRLNWSAVTKGINNSPELYGLKYQIYSHSSNAFFNPDVEGTLLATVNDPSYLLSVDQLRLYLCVRAVDSDNKSVVSSRVGKYGYQLTKGEKPTFNYLSAPLQNSSLKKAKDLAKSIGDGVDVLWKLSSSTNAYSIYYLPNISFGTNFDIKTGAPVIAQVNADAVTPWFYTGNVPAQGSVQFTIYKNAGKTVYNEITLPLDKINIKTADQLAKDIGGVEVIWKLDPATNSFSKYWLPAVKYGENFAIEPGEAVLIGVTNAAPDVWPH